MAHMYINIIILLHPSTVCHFNNTSKFYHRTHLEEMENVKVLRSLAYERDLDTLHFAALVKNDVCLQFQWSQSL